MLIEELRLKNILSFRDATIKLGPLNVLIGPNVRQAAPNCDRLFQAILNYLKCR